VGKVFSQKELEFIGELAVKWDVLCIMDEVYEWLVYEPYQHFRMGLSSPFLKLLTPSRPLLITF
jgi:kynurenine--oxoglutarate transaminase/cysteine-S-conjugate beta-lyase/glutamine--phenylpyruvate transaminase